MGILLGYNRRHKHNSAESHEELMPHENTSTNTHIQTCTCMNPLSDTYSKYKLSTNTGPWSHKPSVKATLIVFPPPSPSVKPRGSSHPRPPLFAHLLCWTARLAGEARGRFGARWSGYLAFGKAVLGGGAGSWMEGG